MRTKGWLFFILGVVLVSSYVNAEYVSDEFFTSRENCVNNGYSEVFYFNNSNNDTLYYCLEMKEYSSDEEFLFDSYLVFGVGECKAGYDDFETFMAYQSVEDYEAGSDVMITVCKKRETRSSEVEIEAIGYIPFDDELIDCSGEIETFVDNTGKTIYHCRTWEPGSVELGEGICKDTDGGDIKSIDEIEEEYGVVLDGDAYGFDPYLYSPQYGLGLTFPYGEKSASEVVEGENFVEVKKDYCKDKYTLHEYYCDASTKQVRGIDLMCPHGGECDNGRCLYPGVARADQQEVEGCYDSDAGENNDSIFGFIDFFSNEGSGYRYYDVCASDGNGLFEYFCKNGSGSGSTMDRFKGEEVLSCSCSSGRCVGDAVVGELCDDEEGCGVGNPCLDDSDCKVWLFCLDGVCTEEYSGEYTCEDSDSLYGLGEDDSSIFTPGSVTKGKAKLVDKCQGKDLREAICAGTSSSEPQDWVAKYKFVPCPEGSDCRDDGDGAYCVKPDSRRVCERLVFNVEEGQDGNDVCKDEDRYGEDAWCDDSEPPEVIGGVERVDRVGCEGAQRRELSCDDVAPQNLRARITCCWEQEYLEDEDARKLQEDEEPISSTSSNQMDMGIGEVFGGLMQILPYLVPLIISFFL